MKLNRALLALAFLLSAAARADDAQPTGMKIQNWPLVQATQATYGTNVTIQNYAGTSSTTAGQTVASYTVPAGVSFYLTYAESESYYLSFTTAVSNFGTAYLSANGIHAYTTQMSGAGLSRSGFLIFNPPLIYPAGTVVAWLVTPAATTGTIWYGNLGGYCK